MDSESIAAALLHDVVEDTPTTLDDLKAAFGEEVALLVDGVTKLTKIQFSNIEELQAENLRKMLLAMSRDVRVMIIKLCDRLHNMRTGDAWPEQKRRDKARETMEVYAPIANRLGILNVKEELEDRSLHYLDPVGYEEISRMLSERAGEEFLAKVSGVIERRLAESGIEGATIKRRVKSIYGIYRKTIMQNKSFDEIYDIYAVRVILDTLAECYSTLGLIHDMYHPLPNRFKDYISTPSPMATRACTPPSSATRASPLRCRSAPARWTSRPSTALRPTGSIKEGLDGHDKLDERLAWVSQLLENQRVSEDSGNLLHDLKSDLLPEEVFAFTPQGRCHQPAHRRYLHRFCLCDPFGGGQPHGGLQGEQPHGAHRPHRFHRRDHRSDPWPGGQRPQPRLAQDRAHQRSEEQDPKLVQKRCAARKISRRDVMRWPVSCAGNDHHSGRPAGRFYQQLLPPPAPEQCRGALCRHRLRRHDHCQLPAQAQGGVAEAESFGGKGRGRPAQGGPEPCASLPTAWWWKGFDNTPIKFAKCCSPLPGDPIVGFITRGFGVSIHKQSCVNAISSMKDPTNAPRWVKAYWADSVKDSYKAGIEIIALNRNELLQDVLAALADIRVPIYAVNARQVEKQLRHGQPDHRHQQYRAPQPRGRKTFQGKGCAQGDKELKHACSHSGGVFRQCAGKRR